MTYGTADFFGGVATRRANRVLSVVLTTQTAGLIFVLLVLPFVEGTLLARDAAIAALGGLGGVLGLLCFYRSLAIGPMSIAAPLSAVLAALVPLGTGLALGERPDAIAWVGIPLALVAIVLFSREPDDSKAAGANSRVIVLAVLAGIGFGGFFVALDKVSADAGLWPVVIGRAVSALAVGIVVIATKSPARLGRSAFPVALVCGVFDTLANVFILLANREGDLSTVAVVSSLYPAATVSLALVVLHEPFTRARQLAAAAALGAVTLIALGQGAEATDASPETKSRQIDVADRGAAVMGFDLKTTTHVFRENDFGGEQTVTADDPNDTIEIANIRSHLAAVAVRFGDGDFSDPGHIHGDDMPGLVELGAAGDALDVAYVEVDAGARIIYRSDRPDVVDAIHRWFAAQRRDHGDHTSGG